MRGIVLALLAACSYSPTRAPGDSGGDAAPVCDVVWPYSPSNFSPCDGMPEAVVNLTTGLYTFDTATGDLGRFMVEDTLPVVGTGPIVVPLLSLTIGVGVTLTIVGPGPVIFAVHGSASIAGEVIISATGATSGSGAATDCTAMAGANADALLADAGGAGGAGGAFGGPGASGGNGDTTNGAPQTLGGMMSTSVGEPLLVPLRGGCAGGAGGEEHPMAPPDATPGAGGGGGGAIQISARDALALGATARLQANGGGGRGANNAGSGSTSRHVGAGGGGGGSGGAIFLEGNIVMIASAARLCANGGGPAAAATKTPTARAGSTACAPIQLRPRAASATATVGMARSP